MIDFRGDCMYYVESAMYYFTNKLFSLLVVSLARLFPRTSPERPHFPLFFLDAKPNQIKSNQIQSNPIQPTIKMHPYNLLIQRPS